MNRNYKEHTKNVLNTLTRGTLNTLKTLLKERFELWNNTILDIT